MFLSLFTLIKKCTRTGFFSVRNSPLTTLFPAAVTLSELFKYTTRSARLQVEPLGVCVELNLAFLVLQIVSMCCTLFSVVAVRFLVVFQLWELLEKTFAALLGSRK
jgi:hypothetical protein